MLNELLLEFSGQFCCGLRVMEQWQAILFWLVIMPVVQLFPLLLVTHLPLAFARVRIEATRQAVVTYTCGTLFLLVAYAAETNGPIKHWEHFLATALACPIAIIGEAFKLRRRSRHDELKG